MIRNCLLFILFASLSFARPTIATDGIVSAASYLPSGFPNSGIAQGSIFIVFGSGMGPSSIVQNNAFPLQKQLGGTSIKVTVGGTTVDALMIYSLAGQVAAILPSTTPAGTGTLVVTYNGSASDSAPIHVIKNGFGIFTINQAGTGPAVATFADYSVVTLIATGVDRPQTLARPAKPGEVLILWGTGLGPVASTVDESQPASAGDMKNLAASVFVGGKSAQIQYKGRSPGSAGLDQINFKVPAGVTGCFVPVAVQAGGVVSNFGSIAISADGGTCKDPVLDTSGRSPISDVLSKIAGGQNVKLGLVQLSRFGPQFNLPLIGAQTINQDTANGYFYSVNKTQFLSSFGVASLNAFGSCVVWTCRGGTCVPPTQGAATLLDAGSFLTVDGNGPKQLAKSSSGSYSATLGGGSINDPTGYLKPGQYTLTGTGGAGSSAVGAFSASQQVAANPLDLSANSSIASSAAIPLSSDLTLKWSGADPNGYVAIIGTSTSGNSTLGGSSSDPTQVTATFGCTAKGSLGQFTVPAWVLSAMPVSGTLTQQGTNIVVNNGFLLIGNFPAFTPLHAPNLDLGYFTNIVLSGWNVAYQ
ncbi:MAG TPA: hypothetical protein VNH83_29890 [Bryobacteraceae bacterium]|nr:hypothetical protein [Bryobacteraceae bacterium]